jgi:hypothetical protein
MEIVEDTGCQGHRCDGKTIVTQECPTVGLMTSSPFPPCLQHPGLIVACDVRVRYTVPDKALCQWWA